MAQAICPPTAFVVITAPAICPVGGQALHFQSRDRHCSICAGSVGAASRQGELPRQGGAAGHPGQAETGRLPGGHSPTLLCPVQLPAQDQ